MKDEGRTKKQLIDELISLRLKVSKLEESQNKLRLKASELRKAQERFAMLSIATNDAVHDWDLVKNQLWCNEGMQKTLGVPEVIDDPWNWWMQIIHPDDRDRMVSGMERLLKSNREFGSNEYRIKTASGTPVYINHRIYVLRDRKGKPFRIMGAARNITERKRAEEALRESEERYRAFFETSRDCVFISSPEGRWIDLNDAAVELFGYSSREELENVHIRDLYADPEGRNRFIAQMREKGYVKEYPFDMRRKDGSIRNTLLTSVVWKDADGNVLGYRGTIRDVTEKRSIEKNLKAKHEELSAAYGQLSAYGEELRQKYTELLESQQSLHESETRYRAMFQHMGSGVAVYETRDDGETFIFKDFNRAGETIENIKREELIGRSVTDVFPGVKEFGILDVFRRVWRTGVLERHPVSLYKDGRLSSWRDNFVYKLPTGEIVAIYDDVTKSKQAEEALRQSEEQYRSLAHTGDSIYIVDAEQRYLFMNEGHLKRFGMPLERIVGRPYSDFHSNENSEKFAQTVKIVFETGTFIQQDHTSERDGRFFIRTFSPVVEESGEVRAVTVVSKDITDRKQTEEALRESETKLQAIFDTVGTGILIIDRNTQIIIEANQTAIEMTGLSKERIIGQSCHSLICLAEVGKCPVKDLGQSIDHSERKLLCADGHLTDILKTVYPITIKGRDCYLENFIDITEQKRAEGERRRLEERLQRAEKMEALGTLAGGVAHDLNNVLGVLVGYSELLLQNLPQDSPLRRHALHILKGGERAAAIIQDLLTLTRRGVVVSDVVSLNMVISDFLQTPEFEAVKTHHPGVTFKTSLDAELLNVKGSPTHLGKTVMNLLSNAAEAITGLGEVLITTENRYVDRPIHGYENTHEGEYAVLTVSDTGSGIASSDIGRIFEPFYTKKVMGRSGTGLGLAVVWGTVKDHSGYIDVQSIEGKETIFTLYFPVTREDLTKVEQVVPQSTYLGRGEHILVVDDVEGQRLLASAMLEGIGYKVSAVAGGEEAIGFVKKQPVDLLILDMIMDPGIDGLETYRRILEIRKDQKAIIVSGFAMTESVRQAQELGAGTYVKKPYLLEKIGIAVRKELDK
jgi:PAS domain S-box-containing protein